jgi:hypothetical protein
VITEAPWDRRKLHRFVRLPIVFSSFFPQKIEADSEPPSKSPEAGGAYRTNSRVPHRQLCPALRRRAGGRREDERPFVVERHASPDSEPAAGEEYGEGAGSAVYSSSQAIISSQDF